MKLVKHTTNDFGTTDLFGNTKRSEHWGRKHYFLIENASAAELEAMEELMEMAGWETDGCPCYEDGFTSGFHIDIEEVPAFKEAYKEAKKALPLYMEQKAVEAERAAEPARRQAEFFAQPDHKQAFAIESAHATALEMEAEFEASPLRRLLNASDHLNPASDALIEFLEKSPVVGCLYKHRNPNISEKFVVTPRTVYVVYDEAKARCKRLAEVTPDQIVSNGLCFEMVSSSVSYSPLAGVVANDDNPFDNDYLDNLLATIFVIPVPEPEEDPAFIAMDEALEELYGTYTIPDLLVDEQGVIGSWLERGETKTVRLYLGDDIKTAYDYAAQRNELEIAAWDAQQKAEQAAEARNERYFEEGNGAHAFYYEDMERWGR